MRIRKIVSLVLVMILVWQIASPALAGIFVLPTEVKVIETGAFEGNQSIGDVTLPAGIERIESRAFADSSVGHVYLPESLTFIAPDAFNNTPFSDLSADKGSYAHGWMKLNWFMLSFSDDQARNPVVKRAASGPNPEINLYTDSFLYRYELKDADTLKENLDGDPQWSVVQTEGPEADYWLVPDGKYAVSLHRPTSEESCTVSFDVSCRWGAHVITSHIIIHYIDPGPESFPVFTDIPESVHLAVGRENVLDYSYYPSDFDFWDDHRAELADYTGEAEWRCVGHRLYIKPLSNGEFTGKIRLYGANIYMEKEVRFTVSEADVLSFSDFEAYNLTVNRAASGPNPEIGLYTDSFLYRYELYDPYTLADNLDGDPEWSVVQPEGQEAECRLVPDGKYAVSLHRTTPEEPRTESFDVSCRWGGYVITSHITVHYIDPGPESFPVFTDIPDNVQLTVRRENLLAYSYYPSDFNFWNDFRAELADYTGAVEWRYEGHRLYITPLNKGEFTGKIRLYGANIYMEKEVRFTVSEAEGLLLSTGEKVSLDLSLADGDDGLQTDNFVCYYELTNYDQYAGILDGVPEWAAEVLEGSDTGCFFEVTERGARLMVNPPENPETIFCGVTCNWGGKSASCLTEIHYSYPPVTVNNIPNVIELNMGEKSLLEFAFLAEDSPVSGEDSVEFVPEGGTWDISTSGHSLLIVPHTLGEFTATVTLRSGNLYTSKTVTVLVEEPAPLRPEEGDFSFLKLETDGTEDEEELAAINEINAGLDEAEQALQDYNAALDELAEGFLLLNDVTDCLATVDDNTGISFSTGEASFAVRGNAVDRLSDGYEPGETLTSGAIIQTEMIYGNNTLYLITDNNGITVSDTPVIQAEASAQANGTAPRGRARNSLMYDIDVAIENAADLIERAFTIVDSYFIIAERIVEELVYKLTIDSRLEAWNLIRDGETKTAKYQQLETKIASAKGVLKGIRKFARMWSGLGIGLSLGTIRSDMIKIGRLKAIREHGHPTEEDFLSDNVDTAMNMESDIAEAIGFLRGDAACDIVSIALSIEELVDSLVVLFPAGYAWRLAARLVVTAAQLVVNYVSLAVDKKAEEKYNAVMKTDRYLHDWETVTGVVTDRDTGEGLFGVYITTEDAYASTDANGCFSFRTKQEKPHIVYLKDGYYKGEKDIDLSATHDADMQLGQHTGKLYGIVWGKNNELLQGATVEVDGQTVYTGAVGTYAIYLIPGTYTVRFSKEGYESKNLVATVSADGKTKLNCVLNEPGYGDLWGRVYDRNTLQPISGVTVMYNRNGTALYCTTGADGLYSFRIPVGQFGELTVASVNGMISAKGYVPNPWKYYNVGVPEDHADQPVIQNIPMQQAGKYTIVGHVRGWESIVEIPWQSGRRIPLSGVIVSSGSHTTTTDENGDFIIEIDEPGATVTFTKEYYKQTSMQYYPNPRYEYEFMEVPSVDMDLGGGNLKVTLYPARYKQTAAYAKKTDPENWGYHDYSVYLYPWGWDYKMTFDDYEWTLSCAPGESVTYKRLPAGIHRISFSLDGLQPITDFITITEGETTEWEMELPWTSGTVITVRDGDGGLFSAENPAYVNIRIGYEETTLYTDNLSCVYVFSPYNIWAKAGAAKHYESITHTINKQESVQTHTIQLEWNPKYLPK